MFVRSFTSNQTTCETLAENILLTKEYLDEYESFKKTVEELKKEYGKGEGHTGKFESQHKIYHYISTLKFVNTVCEIGFNEGHSGFFLACGKTHKSALFL